MSKAVDKFFRRLRRRFPGKWHVIAYTGAIRATDSRYCSQCPLTAAANMNSVYEYSRAGMSLGMTADEIDLIVDAADNGLPTTEEAIHMRMRLLRACGLAP